jgi:hypothetical protein
MTFQKTLLDVNNGAAVVELSEKLAAVVAAVRATGKAGSVTLTLKVARASKNTPDVFLLSADVKARVPEPERGSTIFYATDENMLVRNDPKQQMLPLRVVDIEAPQRGELKEVG